MRILKGIGIVLVGLVLVAGIAYLLRTDPIGPIAGKRLSGEEVAEQVGSWAFTDAHGLIAVESRPEDPHSVTTICFTHEGALYVPARDGAEKDWPQYVLADPRVRLKIGDRIYRGHATRVDTEMDREPLLASLREKYAEMLAQADEPPDLSSVWLFRIDPA